MSKAVLVIDVQSGLFDGAARPAEADLVVRKINAVTVRARAAGAPVIFVQHERPGSPLEHGTSAWQFQRNLKVVEGDAIVPKSTPDSFLHTTLSELLSARGVRQLVICGFASEFCVDTTTRRAAALGFDVQLLSDAHTTHDKPHATGTQIREHHNATLVNIMSFDGKISATVAADVNF